LRSARVRCARAGRTLAVVPLSTEVEADAPELLLLLEVDDCVVLLVIGAAADVVLDVVVLAVPPALSDVPQLRFGEARPPRLPPFIALAVEVQPAPAVEVGAFLPPLADWAIATPANRCRSGSQ
jgi:hypothetical protein